MVGLYVDVVGVEYFDGVVFVGEVDCVVGVFQMQVDVVGYCQVVIVVIEVQVCNGYVVVGLQYDVGGLCFQVIDIYG